MRRTAGRPAAARGRRGAVLPLACVLLTVLLGFAAVAVDLARLRYTAAELQAVADAAALAAARAMQLRAVSASSAAPTAAASVASANRAGGRAGSVAAADVDPKVYSPASRTAVDAAGWDKANAVEVTARAPGAFLFARTLGLTAPGVARSATAWIANVDAAGCINPILLPYSALYYLGFGDPQPRPAPDVTQAQLNQIAEWTPSYRTIALVPPDANAVAIDNAGNNNYGNWVAADFTGRGRADEFGDWVGQRNCAAAYAEARRTGLVTMAWPGAGAGGGAVLQATNGGMANVCNFRGTGVATCWSNPTTAVAGVRTRIIYGDFPVTALAGRAVSVRAVGELRVMCYYRASTDNCPDQPGYPGGWYTPQFPNTGYPAGTVVGIVDAPVSVDLTPSTVLGDVVTNVQRVVLVR